MPGSQQHRERRLEAAPRLQLEAEAAAWVALPVRAVDLAGRARVHAGRDDDLGTVAKVQIHALARRRRVVCQALPCGVVGEASQQVQRVVVGTWQPAAQAAEDGREKVGALRQRWGHRKRHLLCEQTEHLVDGREDAQRGARIVHGALEPDDDSARACASGGALRGRGDDAVCVHAAEGRSDRHGEVSRPLALEKVLEEIGAQAATHRYHRVVGGVTRSVNLVHHLLRHAGLLGQPVVVLLNETVQVPRTLQPDQYSVRERRLRAEGALV
mmetsp:Transcript_21943/g.37483  ORF Transcript_21943/g.37483 Transcript_21943/m.37483 type:complete len:270 (-) Transcript_21943:638-1447(-)